MADTLTTEPGTDARITGGRVGVLLPLPLDGAYDYRVPAGLGLAEGDVVSVPLGGRVVAGVVWGPAAGDVAEAKLKDVAGRLDVPPLPAGLRRFVDWTAGYTLAPRGAVLRMALSVPKALEPPRPTLAYALASGVIERIETGTAGLRLTPARKRVVAVLAGGPPRPPTELAREAGVTPAVVRGLADAGVLVPVPLTAAAAPPAPDWRVAGPVLSAPQRAAADVLAGAVGQGFSVTVLDGVTGSGKTEVYFEAIAAALSQGRQALVLVPEIALTAQWLERFERRFGARPVEWHSDLTGVQRRAAWRAVAAGRAPVVVGARSALYLPHPALGLIVVDEEHDSSFKQEDGVIYNARDMAVVRARIEAIPIALVSATPSLETMVNVARGRYRHLALPERHAGAALPEIGLIDMRAEAAAGRQSWISPTLRDALAQALASGEQAMLFLNRRGYAPLTLCRACGHRLECPNCSAWLVEHRLEGRLACHHCGFTTRPPATCPECGAEGRFAPCGPGVERLAEEVAAAFPQARAAIMASDTLTGPNAASELVRRMARHEIDVLIGTQVMAKGHHFPMLTLVGVVDADLGLAGGDLRAAERTFQLLSQVAGRAGRAERPGKVWLQTFLPDHPVMKALVSGQREAFYEAEGRRAARARHAAVRPARRADRLGPRRARGGGGRRRAGPRRAAWRRGRGAGPGARAARPAARPAPPPASPQGRPRGRRAGDAARLARPGDGARRGARPGRRRPV